MTIRPWFLLYRTRLIIAAVACLFGPVISLFAVAADGPLDFGVFWHHFCGCPMGPTDARILAEGLVFGSVVTAFTLALSVSAVKPGASGPQGFNLFLMTRPVPRRDLILKPFAIAAVAIAVFPVASWLILLGWLKLVHAPSLGALVTAAELMPSAAHLGAHPTFFALLAALHMGRRLLIAWTLGLCIYALYAMQRWLLLSNSSTLRVIGALYGIFPAFIPTLMFFNRRWLNLAVLFPPAGSPLGYLSSAQNVVIHATLCATLLYASWELLRRVDG